MLANSLRQVVRVHVYHTANELTTSSTSDPVVVLVAGRAGVGREALDDAFDRLDMRVPRPALTLYCDQTPEAILHITQLSRRGADGILFAADCQASTLLSRLLSLAPRGTNGIRSWDFLQNCPPLAAPILSYCLRHSDEPLAVTAIAEGLGISRRTLANRLRAARWPAPQTLIAWCRILAAAEALGSASEPIERVAHRLGFGSARGLRAMFRRYTGMSPATTRSRTGRDLIWAKFRELTDVNNCDRQCPRGHNDRSRNSGTLDPPC